MAYKRIVTKLPFRAEDVYKMIADIQHYPEFIPHCNAIEIHEESANEIIATMYINYITLLKNIKLFYTSKITLNAASYTILITENTPLIFKIFENIWEIRPSIEGCEIVYDMKFEIKNPLLNLALSKLVIENSDKIVAAFKKRAYNTLIHIK